MSSKQSGKKVLLIGWDAADWKFINPLLDGGFMPNLNRIVEAGVVANLASLNPCLSPILWTSIATGKTADKHGITGFVEPVPGGGGVRLSSSTSRKTKALWNILSQNGIRSVVVNWYASHPAEPIVGTCVSNRFFEGIPVNSNDPWIVVPDSVQPVSLLESIADFRMHPAEFSVEDIQRFIPSIREIDLGLDTRPIQLAEVLARSVSVHSIATGAMESEEWDFLAVYYDGLDVGGHLFMPYHPPKLPSVPERDFELYQHVMRELYLFYDEMLGRLLELAGPETTVVLISDHGFHSNHLRPQVFNSDASESEQAAKWHRHYGILAMKGPELLVDERIYGATLLNIAPTILTLFGLPTGKDMNGTPLVQAFKDQAIEIRSIPSWDLVPGNDGMHPANVQQAMMDSPEVIAQLVALGYLPAETKESQKAVEIAIAESQFNLAIVHSSHRRPQVAQEILERLYSRYPEQTRYALSLAKVYANQQLHQKCLDLLESVRATGVRSLDSDLLYAAELFNVGRSTDSLEVLVQAEASYPANSVVFRIFGDVYLQKSDWKRARIALENSIQLDDEDPHVHNALAQALIQLGEFEKAGEHALQAVGLLFFFPKAHFNMGVAFNELGDTHRAIRSLELAVSQSPGFLEAHAKLAQIYERINNIEGWMKHQRLAQGLPSID